MRSSHVPNSRLRTLSVVYEAEDGSGVSCILSTYLCNSFGILNMALNKARLLGNVFGHYGQCRVKCCVSRDSNESSSVRVRLLAA